jgi:hypothetical protein
VIPGPPEYPANTCMDLKHKRPGGYRPDLCTFRQTLFYQKLFPFLAFAF